MSDLVRRLNDYWPDDGDFGPTKLCREAAIALMAAQERNKRLELENEELRGACLAEAMQATPLTEHGKAIAAGDGTLHGAIDYWQEQAFTMAAGQCCVKDGGLMGDEHGHQYCDMERQRDELKERAEKAESDLAACLRHAEAMEITLDHWASIDACKCAALDAFRAFRDSLKEPSND